MNTPESKKKKVISLDSLDPIDDFDDILGASHSFPATQIIEDNFDSLDTPRGLDGSTARADSHYHAIVKSGKRGGSTSTTASSKSVTADSQRGNRIDLSYAVWDEEETKEKFHVVWHRFLRTELPSTTSIRATGVFHAGDKRFFGLITDAMWTGPDGEVKATVLRMHDYYTVEEIVADSLKNQPYPYHVDPLLEAPKRT